MKKSSKISSSSSFSFLLLLLCCMVQLNAQQSKDIKRNGIIKDIKFGKNQQPTIQEAQPILKKTHSQVQRTCNHESHMNSLRQNHEYAARHQERQHRFQILHQNNPKLNRAQCASSVTLPVAVHYQGLPEGYDAACLTALAIDQIRILNEDFGGYNADISIWNNSTSQYYPTVSNGETCISFCLATQNHPSEYELTNGSPAVTFNTTSGGFDENWSGYINIWVRANTGSLGSAPLGGSGEGDGVVIDAAAFGSGAGCTGVVPGAPYNLGRTLTHELGHYLNLRHIWGGGCTDDDGVSDTPSQGGYNGGCPALDSTASCGTEDLHMNYMDYTNDACMYMFSADQSTRMENYVTANLQDVVEKYDTVCLLPTCYDGIQNGDEEGVDCGGSSCISCSAGCLAATISNSDFESGWGIWNDGGIDVRRSIDDAVYANSGSYCIRLSDNSGEASSMTSDVLDLSNYGEITISHSIYARSMEPDEDYFVEINTGSGWITVANYIRGPYFRNNIRYNHAETVEGPFSAATIIRFRNDASGNSDWIHIDDVNIEGCIYPSIVNTPGTPTADNSSKEDGMENNKADKMEDAVANEINIFPNPTRDILNISFAADSEMVSINIYNQLGQLVMAKHVDTGTNTIQLPVADLTPGNYFVSLVIDGERTVQKFVKY